MWFDLRRVLADARAAFAISDEDADRLRADGHQPASCGIRLTPRKLIFFVDEARLSALASRREIPVGLGPDFLAAGAVVLLAFEDLRPDGRE